VKVSSHTRRFLQSTRGQIVELLRERPSTVAELADKLSLTDNAVRAHLATLERDGLVRQSGERSGLRKPHFTYELTSEAEDLFPKAYAPVLNAVLEKMETSLGKERSAEFLRQLGREMAAPHRNPGATFESKLTTALKLIEGFGGQVRIERDGENIAICGAGCPLAAVVSQHDLVCDMLTEFIAQVVDCTVSQNCQREERPQCRFEIQTSTKDL
jgi:predicted ArsR family transcriptional regulator